jgi:vacuolar-type H+-ATPase subunit I/STV1
MADKEKTEGLGISGFTLGILGIVFSGWIGLIISIIGFMFCFVQQKRHKEKLAKIGIILNLIGAALSIAYIILSYTVLGPLLNSVSGA